MVVKQASIFDGLPFDAFAPQQDGSYRGSALTH
jgi:hypothetical protein